MLKKKILCAGAKWRLNSCLLAVQNTRDRYGQYSSTNHFFCGLSITTYN